MRWNISEHGWCAQSVSQMLHMDMYEFSDHADKVGLLLSSFYKWGLERFCDLFKDTQAWFPQKIKHLT